MSGPLRVVYIAGSGRSGSTLVAQYLESRTDAVHVGELRYLWERGLRDNHLCECGQQFRSCPFWTDVLAAAYGADLDQAAREMARVAPKVDRLRWMPNGYLHAGSEYLADLESYERTLLPLYRAIVSVSGAELVVDSSKDPSYLFALDGFAGLMVTPLHLVRDPRAVAFSWTRVRSRPEIHWEAAYMKTVPPRKTATNWLVYNSAIELLMARRRVGTRLRYEDFAVDPDGTTRSALAALGVRDESGLGSRPGHSLSGNPSRFEKGPLVVKLDHEWQHELPRARRNEVTAITLPLLRHYGYPVRVTAAR